MRRCGRFAGGGVVLGAVLVGGVVLLGACGDDDDGGGGLGASSSIAVETRDFGFEPQTWAVPAGEEITVGLENAGETDHEWVVLAEGEDIETESEFEEDKVEFEIEATPAGESVTETFTIDDPGTHQVICALPGHFTAGMEGTLTVE